MLGKAETTTPAAKMNSFYTFVNASTVIKGTVFKKATLKDVERSRAAAHSLDYCMAI